MACDVPIRQCLEWHVRANLLPGASKVLTDAEGFAYIAARCPAHDDRKPSLRITEGKQKRLVWFCHARCSDGKIRHALIKRGIEPACLPRPAAELRDMEEALRELLTSGLSHADVRLRALALLDSPDGKLPGGAELAALAAAVHVSRSGAFRARAEGLHPTTR